MTAETLARAVMGTKPQFGTPEWFIEGLAAGKTWKELRQVQFPESAEVLRCYPMRKADWRNGVKPSLKYLMRYRKMTEQEAVSYINTDYSNGFFLCRLCGSFCSTARGNLRHVSYGCHGCKDELYPMTHHRVNGTRRRHRVRRYSAYRGGYVNGYETEVYGGQMVLMGAYFGGGYHVRADRVEARKYEAVIDDVLGPLEFLPEWRTEAVCGLARGIVDNKAKDCLPILADALEDAGATGEVVSYCRQIVEEFYPRFWVLEEILGSTSPIYL